MTLPSNVALEPSATEPPVDAQLFDPDPLGGKVAHFAAEPGAPGAAPDKGLTPQLFAAAPIGGEAYRLTSRAKPSRAKPSRAVAENTAPEAARPTLQGRSVSKQPVGRAHRALRAAVMTAHGRGDRLSSCHCGLRTGRSVSVPARRWRPESEGHADLPAPRAPAGLVTIVPF